MKKAFFCLLIGIGINFFYTGCAEKFTSRNSVHISPVPAQTLQLAQVYQANLDILEQAFQAGIIDEQYYLSAKYQFSKALQDQLEMHEGDTHNEVFTAPKLDED